MGQVLVRKLEDEVIAQLKAKARKQGTSLEALARQALRDAAKPTQKEVWAEIDRLRNELGPVDWDSTKFIREQRDRGYSGYRCVGGDEVVPAGRRKRESG